VEKGKGPRVQGSQGSRCRGLKRKNRRREEKQGIKERAYKIQRAEDWAKTLSTVFINIQNNQKIMKLMEGKGIQEAERILEGV
jgi:predicted carbohydrate-binding protein with CBM5 and CBM33 domain